jgi:hypothetical protein
VLYPLPLNAGLLNSNSNSPAETGVARKKAVIIIFFIGKPSTIIYREG